MPALEVGLSQADFYRERHGVVFAAMRALHQANEPIEHLTVPEQLQRQGQLEEVGGSGAIEELAASVHRWPPGTRLPTHQAALAGATETGAEGRTSHLKRRYGLDRSRLKGDQGQQIWTEWGILAYNADTRAVRTR